MQSHQEYAKYCNEVPIPMERGSEPSTAMVYPSDGPKMPTPFLAPSTVSWLDIPPVQGQYSTYLAAQNTNPMLTMISNNAF
jgi:hypothetical protein